MIRKLLNLILIISSILFLGYQIAIRYLYKRPSRIIPFELTELSFILLLVSCFISIINIIVLVINYNKKENFISAAFDNFLSKPFKIFVEFCLKNNKTNQYFQNIVINIILAKLLTINQKYLYMVINLLPKIFLAIVFFIETMFFNKIQYFYILVILTIFAMSYKFILQTFKVIINNNIRLLDERCEIFCYNFNNSNTHILPIISAKDLIYQQTFRILNNLNELEFMISFKTSYVDQERKRLGIPNAVLDIKLFNKKMRRRINAAVTFNKIVLLFNQQQTNYKSINIFINIIFIICWSYIAFKSYLKVKQFIILPQLYAVILMILPYLVQQEEPFSGLLL